MTTYTIFAYFEETNSNEFRVMEIHLATMIPNIPEYMEAMEAHHYEIKEDIIPPQPPQDLYP